MNKRLGLGVIVMITLGTTLAVSAILHPLQQYTAYAKQISDKDARLAAPVALSGDNIYVAWWANKTGNDEVMFRASTDAGKSFGDKMNLSNTPNTDSVNVEISASGKNVAVSWWERNQTSNEPVMKVSNDNGKTFGPLLKLATNGTIGQ